MTEKGVIDKISDGRAVILVSDKEEEYVISQNRLPMEVKEGDWLKIEFDGEEIGHIEFDGDQTRKMKDRIEKKMENLRKRIR